MRVRVKVRVRVRVRVGVSTAREGEAREVEVRVVVEGLDAQSLLEERHCLRVAPRLREQIAELVGGLRRARVVSPCGAEEAHVISPLEIATQRARAARGERGAPRVGCGA